MSKFMEEQSIVHGILGEQSVMCCCWVTKVVENRKELKNDEKSSRKCPGRLSQYPEVLTAPVRNLNFNIYRAKD